MPSVASGRQFPCIKPLLMLCFGLFAAGHTWLEESRAADSAVKSVKSDAALPAAGPTAAVPRPPADLIVSDRPNDVGDALIVRWQPSPDDRSGVTPRQVTGYAIWRSESGPGGFQRINQVPYSRTEFTDPQVKRGTAYLYRVTALGADGRESEPVTLAAPVSPQLNLVDTSRLWFGGIVVVVCGAVLLFTELVKAGRKFHVRKIAGLAAVDEAVGRATEMGRSSLFVPGIQDMNDIQTVAGLTILSHVARVAAEYDSEIEVPTARSMVMTAAREASQASYLAAGRPEAYQPERIYYVTDDQFGYVAAVSGKMVRDKPAACFYLGAFYAESLILAENGNAIGAIQIAGTAEPSQLPFFVAACDYTLIGEELFAASAYLSGEPHQLGSLKGQDAGKVIAVALLLAGCGLATAVMLFPDWHVARQMLSFLTDTVLSKGAAG